MQLTPAFPCANVNGRGFQAGAQRAGKLACLSDLVAICAHLFCSASRAVAEESAVHRVEAGKQLFQSICARCHGPDGRGGPQRDTMPAIPNFTDAKWQKNHSNIQMMISILEGKNLQMPANRGPVTEETAPDLVAYIRTFGPVLPPPPPFPPPGGSSNFEVEFNKLVQEWEDLARQFRDLSSASAAATVSKESAVAALAARPITQDDIERGRELFMGQRPLAAGGASCIACHAVGGSGPREGGRLGPDLTKIYERLGGRADLAAQLLTPTTPAMCALYQQHTLQPDEASSLAAYLEETDKQGVEQASGPPLSLFLMGLGGTVLGLATVSTFWKSRYVPQSRPPLNGKAPAPRRSENGHPVRGKRRAKVEAARPAAATAQLPEAYLGSGL